MEGQHTSAPAEAPAAARRDWRCRAEVDLKALRCNADLCREAAGPGARLMAVVKADAYGHGLAAVVRALADAAPWFGVASLREAETVSEAAGAAAEGILVLGPTLPDERDALVAGGFSATVSSPGEVEAFAAAAARAGQRARLHAAADTGMGRMGAAKGDFPALLAAVAAEPLCLLEGVSTHFPCADEDEEFTLAQIREFEELLHAAAPPPGCLIHLCNSAGLLGYAERTRFATLARPGLALYGVSPLAQKGAGLQPALRWTTRVALVREIPAGTGISYGRTFVSQKPMRVATLAAGYGDGYPRHLSGAGAEVLVGGRRRRLLGRVTMDQIVVDVTGSGEVAPGDEAVLLGTQGEETVAAAEIAEKAGTIPWEIFTGITARVERVYRNGEAIPPEGAPL